MEDQVRGVAQAVEGREVSLGEEAKGGRERLGTL